MSWITLRRSFRPKTLAGAAGTAAVFFAIAIVIAYFVATNAMARRLEAAWKLSEEFGLPRDLDALLSAKIPEGENAAYPMGTAASIARTFFAAERNRFGVLYDDIQLNDRKVLERMDGLLAEVDYEQSLADADQRPGYHSLAVFASPLATTKFVHVEAQRELVHAEQAIARRLASFGKRKDAVRRLLRMSRLTRRWEDKEPFLVAALTNIALRTKIIWELNFILREVGPLSSALHDEIDQEAAQAENFLKILPRVGEVEKLMVVDLRDKSGLPGLHAVNRLSRDEDCAFMVRQINGVEKTFDRPFHLVKPEVDAFDSDMLALLRDPVGKWTHAGSQFLMPAFGFGRKTFDRLIALSRCLRIVNAMARKKDFAAQPDSLGLPQRVLTDPFDGKPMRLIQTPHGPVIYSVSYDLKDDGGVVNPTFKDVGLGPAENQVMK